MTDHRQYKQDISNSHLDGQVIGSLSETLANTLDVREFEKALEVIALIIRESIGAHQSAVSYIPDGKFEHAIHSVSLSDKYAKYRDYNVLPTGQGIWSIIFEKGCSMRLSQDELYAHPRFKHFSDLKTKSGLEHPPLPGWLAVPIKRDNDQIVGVLQLSDKHLGDFSEHDEDVLGHFAKLVAVSFELQYVRDEVNKTQHQKERLKKDFLELKLLHDATTSISSSGNEEEAYLHCITSICRIIDWPIGHVYILDESRENLVTSRIWYTADPKQAEKFIEITEQTTFSKGIGLPGRILATRKPAWIIDVYQDANFPRAAQCKDLNIHGAVGFPIIVNDNIIAVLEFFSYRSEIENSEVLEVFNILSQQLGHILERKRIERQVEELAHFDHITRLPNRAQFYNILKSCIDRANRLKYQFAVLFIDIDNFKQVNDNYGHQIGDELLKVIAERIKEVIRDMDYLARIGGDEFTIILDALESSEIVGNIAIRINELVSQVYHVHNHELHVSCSIGISMYPTAATSLVDLIKYADIAMYRAKSAGKNTFQFYTDELNKAHIRRMGIENGLYHALENNEFHLVYQPLFNMDDQLISGIEVLLRWESPQLGTVAPDEFIPIAESIGIIIDIGNWVLEKSIAKLSELSQSYSSIKLSMHINCSVLQFQTSNFYSKVEALLKRYDIDGNQLVFEVTETVLMQYMEEVREDLHKLDELGIEIAIDDFGTGYSSLIYLKKLPISILKIDKSFVFGITDNEDDFIIVTSIINLAKAMTLKVVAEGVETKEQVHALLSLDCKQAQGYYYSKPLTESEMKAFFDEKLEENHG